MATPNPAFKTERTKARKTHRDLIQIALQHLAADEQAKNPEISYAKAGAKATLRLAEELKISRPWLVNMRRRNLVSSHHWAAFEQATGGKVKAKDFERARSRYDDQSAAGAG